MKYITEFLNKNLYKFIILVVLLLTAIIYIYKIDLLPLGYDELFTINVVDLQSLQEVIHEGNIEDTHPPLYHFLLFIFVKIFGITELSIRLFSAFCGILSVYFIFVLSKKIFSLKEGIISSILLMFNTYVMQINQFARDYALFVLLSILTFIYLFNIMKNQKTLINKDTLLYVIFSTLNIYTHYFALFLLGNQMLFLLIFYRKKSIKYLLFFSVTIFLLYCPWIKFIEQKAVATSNIDYFKWLEDCIFFNYQYKIVFIILLMVPILVLVYNKIFKNMSFKFIVENFKQELFLLFFCIIPFCLLFFIDKCLFNCYTERYVVFLIPIYVVLISRGITLILKNFIIESVFVFALSISLSFHLLNYKVNSFTGFYCDNPKGALQCMSAIYKLNRSKDIDLLFVGVHFFDYYIDKYLTEIPKNKITIIDWRKCKVDGDIVDFLEQKKPEYVLALQSCHTTYLQDNYTIVFTEHFNCFFDVCLIKIR
ncbi:MAG: glycosyltransferase family 39 protein [Elusimicrobia bacterium]|nr:glycosyltransferase family 39 protein [Elusimicrobiota bacterium]